MKRWSGRRWPTVCALFAVIFVAGPAWLFGYLFYTFKQGWDEGVKHAESDEATLQERLDYYDAER